MELSDVPLTPPIKKCLEEIGHLDAQAKQLICDLQKSKNALALIAQDDNFSVLLQKIKAPALREIVLANLRNQDRPSHGRRWTEKDKENALLIYRQSPKAYRLIEKMFIMPSVWSVSRVLSQIPITVGLNEIVLELIKKKTATLRAVEKECILMFDEIAVKERLIYHEGSPNVLGFEDFGNGERTNNVANRALVFMVQGIASRYKMPIAYYFVRGTISSERLSHLVPQIIRAINATGLNVAATVCDAGETNRGAYEILQASNPPDRPGPYFLVDGQQIVWLWDGPHLWKGWRDNLSGDWEYWLGEQDNGNKFDYPGHKTIWNGKTFKWRYIMDLYIESKQSWGWKKLDENHILPTDKGKMRVNYATQVFSNTIAAFLRCSADIIVASSQKRGVDVSKKEIYEAADIVNEIDELIDCMNGYSSSSDSKATTTRANVSNSSRHLEQWAKFRKIIEKVEIFSWDGRRITPACQKDTIHTLSALQDLWHALKKKGFKELRLRNLNQDPLENTFDQIRHSCGDDNDPTVEQFEASMKTLHITGFLGQHTSTANCEEDDCDMLVTLKEMLTEKYFPVMDEAETE